MPTALRTPCCRGDAFPQQVPQKAVSVRTRVAMAIARVDWECVAPGLRYRTLESLSTTRCVRDADRGEPASGRRFQAVGDAFPSGAHYASAT